MKKTLIIALFCLTIIVSMFGISACANDAVSVYINGLNIAFDVPPQIINGRTMVPMRAIFEELGATVEWIQENQTITGKKGDTTIVLQIGSTELRVNDKVATLDVAPIIIDSRALVPARAVAESLGVDVVWHNDVKVVSILEDKESINYTDLYNLNFELISVENALVSQYEAIGWSKDINDTKATMYASDGRTISIPKAEIEAYKSVGWYTVPVQMMYAADGRTLIVEKKDVVAYQNVGWYINAKDAVASNYPKHNIRVLMTTIDMNSADGVSVEIIWRNDSGKDIKYIDFTAVPYNAVGDVVACEIRGRTATKLSSTGPHNSFDINNMGKYPYFYHKSTKTGVGDRSFVNVDKETGEYKVLDNLTTDINTLETIFSYYYLTNDDCNYIFDIMGIWDVVWYNSTIKDVRISKIEVEYMDGTKETIDNPPIWKTIFNNAGI